MDDWLSLGEIGHRLCKIRKERNPPTRKLIVVKKMTKGENIQYLVMLDSSI
jgi:hypothetical protein